MISTMFDIFLHSLHRQFVVPRDMALSVAARILPFRLVHELDSGWKGLRAQYTPCTYVGVTGEIQSTA